MLDPILSLALIRVYPSQVSITKPVVVSAYWISVKSRSRNSHGYIDRKRSQDFTPGGRQSLDRQSLGNRIWSDLAHGYKKGNKLGVVTAANSIGSLHYKPCVYTLSGITLLPEKSLNLV